MDALKQSMQMKSGQILSRSMLRKIKMLELPYLQFIDSIKKKVDENPLLEIEETGTDADFFSLNNSANYYQDKKSPHDVLSETLTKKESLFNVLKNQLDLSYDENNHQYQIGLSIISSLDKDGLLPALKKENLLKEFPKEDFEQVLEKIKTFHPTGVACSSIKECLLTQLVELEKEKKISLQLEKEIVENHLKGLKRKETLAKKLSVDQAELQHAIENIASLNPRPGALYSSFQPQMVVPEVVVKLVDHHSKIKIEIKESIFPKIKINKRLSEIIEKGKRAKSEFEKQIRKHKEDATSTVDMMEYRKSTLKKTMERLCEVQRDFFLKGLQALKPYTITELAKDIGINVSTASRLVNAKFIETPFGVFPLKIFFSSAKILHTISDKTEVKKEIVSAQHIKQMIKKIIKEANGQKLSDQRLCSILQRQGYTIARRTVNKYRRALEAQIQYS